MTHKIDIDDLTEEEILEALEGLRKKGLIEITPLGYKVIAEVDAAFNHEGSEPKERN